MGAETDTRSILNAAATIRAGQEQLQGDVDKMRAQLSMIAVLVAYAGATALLTFLAVRYGKGVVK